MSDQDILDKLSTIIVQALRVPVDTVIPEARLFLDLGAESLDILDIRFRMENAFGFKIDQDEIAQSITEAGYTTEEIYDGLTVARLAAFIRNRVDGSTLSADPSSAKNQPAGS